MDYLDYVSVIPSLAWGAATSDAAQAFSYGAYEGEPSSLSITNPVGATSWLQLAAVVAAGLLIYTMFFKR